MPSTAATPGTAPASTRTVPGVCPPPTVHPRGTSVQRSANVPSSGGRAGSAGSAAGAREGEELVDRVHRHRGLDDDQPSGDSAGVPVVDRGLLDLVPGDEGDVLLGRGPGPDRGPRVGVTQRPKQPSRLRGQGGDKLRVRSPCGAPVLVGWLGQPVLHDRGPEPLHLGDVGDQVGHVPVRAAGDRQGEVCRASAASPECSSITASSSNPRSVIPAAAYFPDSARAHRTHPRGQQSRVAALRIRAGARALTRTRLGAVRAG